MDLITFLYTMFVIISNTVVQFFISKKDTRAYLLIWGRDIISSIMFIHLGLYWQLYIIAWQFFMSITGYFCWKSEEKTGVKISQLGLLKILFTIKQVRNEDKRPTSTNKTSQETEMSGRRQQ